MLGVSPNTVRDRCKSGALRCERALRPQGEVIRVYVDVQHLPGTSSTARAAAPSMDVQTGTSTGTYNDRQLVPTEIQRTDVMAAALRPLIEAAVDPIRAELADVRAMLSQRDQELGHLRAQFEALQADHLEIALSVDSERAAVWQHRSAGHRAEARALVGVLALASHECYGQ